jgi:hypothetical protein
MYTIQEPLKETKQIGAVYHIGVSRIYGAVSDDCRISGIDSETGEFWYTALQNEYWKVFETVEEALATIKKLDPYNKSFDMFGEQSRFEFFLVEQAVVEMRQVVRRFVKQTKVEEL